MDTAGHFAKNELKEWIVMKKIILGYKIAAIKINLLGTRTEYIS